MPSPEIPPKQSFDAGNRHDGFVRSLARGFAVMRAFSEERTTLTIADVARQCGLTRAGARRILLTLGELGYVKVARRHFYLTARALELGQGFRAQPLWEAARPVLQSIANELNETASAGILEGTDIVYMLRVRSARVLHWNLNPGDRLPAYACSMGRVLLAALSAAELDKYLREATLSKFTPFTVTDPTVLRRRLKEVRQQGWSCVRGEIEESITAISVPLVHPCGRTIAAVHVQLSTARATDDVVTKTIVPLLLGASETISGML